MAGILCVLLLAFPLLVSATDMTRKERAAGPVIVEAVVDLIQASCIFDQDKVFLRRLAYIESNDGLNPKTFRKNYYGGIWQLDNTMFLTLRSPAARPHITGAVNAIKRHFSIDMNTIRWTDLLKPLHSGLAARLYVFYQRKAVFRKPLPRPVPQQATFWSKHYRRGGNVANFIKLANLLERGCTNTGSDIVLLLDGSGSVQRPNFEKIKRFVKSLINSFDVGPDKNQFAVIKFAASVKVEFYLNQHRTKAALLRAVDRIYYGGGGTRTDLALDKMTNDVFTKRRGARDPEQGVPQVGIVLTDGRSNKPRLTVFAALRAHARDFNMFSVGITNSIDMNELKVIGSEPDCLHVYVLRDFSEVESLKDSIERRTCKAPIIIDGNNSNEINGRIPGGRDINCKIKIPKTGTTIKLDPKTGSVIYYIATKTFPSEAYFDRKVIGTKNKQGVMYIPFPKDFVGTEFILFCNIRGDNKTDTNVTINIKPGDKDWCRRKPCKNGECIDKGSRGYICECFAGWTGKNCDINIDECKSNPCRNQGTCLDSINRYTCRCKPGYTGRHCETAIDMCRSRPCQNNGRCVNKNGGYLCVCGPGFTGRHCENRIDHCRPRNPCKNGGQCQNVLTSQLYRCVCRPGTTGKHCEQIIDNCRSSPCQNRGTCVNNVGRYTCICPPGFTGRQCERRVNHCVPNPCRNGASCINRATDYWCRCPVGFTGKHCERRIDFCTPNPCRNNGRCINKGNAYLCVCLPGYTGKNCESRVDRCRPVNPCLNNGRCNTIGNDFRCDCIPGYTGKRCENVINNCASFPCRKGTCHNTPNGYICICEPNWTGKHCEHEFNNNKGYDCKRRNPCTPENTRRNRFYHAHVTKNHFVQCAVDGRCWVMPCAPGTVWSQRAYTCVRGY